MIEKVCRGDFKKNRLFQCNNIFHFGEKKLGKCYSTRGEVADGVIIQTGGSKILIFKGRKS